MPKKMQVQQDEKGRFGLPQKGQKTKLCVMYTVCRQEQKGRQQSSQTSFMLVLVEKATKWTAAYFNEICLSIKEQVTAAVACDKNEADLNAENNCLHNVVR